MNKVNAFTLMEMAIAMLISAIVIGMAYTIYELNMKTFNGFQHKNSSTENLLRLNELLNKDVTRADGIFQSDSGLVMHKDSITVSYLFTTDAIIRRAAITDTFKAEHDLPILLFEGQSVDSQATETEQHRVDEFSFVITSGQDSIPYHFRKQYSSTDLIARSSHADH